MAEAEKLIKLETSKNVSGYEDHGNGVRVNLADGSAVDGTALIGCDGLWSGIRRQLTGEGKPIVSGHIAFRAVLFSMLARRFGLVWAIVLSSIVFGLWHILPSMGTHEQNPALGSVAGEGARGNVIAISLSVLTTAVAGVLFAALRLVSGSVLAPMGVHWATNGLGYAFSWLLIRARNRARERHRRAVRARQAEAPGESGGVE